MRIVALLGAICALMLTLGATSASATAQCDSLGPDPTQLVTGDNFQAADGDQCDPADGGLTSGNAGDIDWHHLAGLASTDEQAVKLFADNDVSDATALSNLGTDPSIFGCNTTAPKELDPSGWCHSANSLQGKSNIITGWLSKRLLTHTAPTPSDLFLRLGFGRIGTQGSVNLDIELNQSADACPAADCPLSPDVPKRIGDGTAFNSDVLLSFDWNGGAAQVTRCYWLGDDQTKPWVSGRWVSPTLKENDGVTPADCDNSAGSPDILDADQALASVNDWDSHAAEPITNFLPHGDFNLVNGAASSTMLDGQFGEADINVTAALGLTSLHPCAAFGSVFMHSRSSTSISSDPKDWVDPQPIRLQTCSTIVIEKATEPTQPAQTDRFLFTQPGTDSTSLAHDALTDTNDGVFDGFGAANTPPSGTDTNTSFHLADGTDRTITNVLPGTYHIGESLSGGPAGYFLRDLTCTDTATSGTASTGSIAGNKLSGTATLNVDAGETVDCVFTNTKPPKLTVKKIVVNSHGGTLSSSNFSLHVKTGGTDVTGSPHAGSVTGTTYTLADNTTYTVSEDAVTGYSGSFTAGDCNSSGQVTLHNGDNKSCTITNVDLTPHLNVVKRVINNNGGSAVPGDFTMNVTATNPSSASFPGVNDTSPNAGTTISLDAGAYSVVEGTHAGYDVTYSAGCAGTATLDHTSTCIVTNNDISPHLNVVKRVINNNGGSAVPGDFTMNVTATNPSSASFPGVNDTSPNAGTTISLDAGAYSVAEGTHAGYDVTYSAGCTGTATLNHTSTCIVTNDDISPHLIVIKHVDNQGTTGGKSAGDFTMNVTATNPSSASFPGDEEGTNITLDAGSYSVDEGDHTGYRESMSADCSGSVALDETKTCTITNTRIVPHLLVVKVRDQDHAYDGDTLSYHYAVTNDGNSALTDIKLTDTVDGHAGCTNFVGPTGDDGDAILSPDETWHYTCSTGFSHDDERVIDGQRQIENIVVASGKDEEGSPVDSLPAHADVPILHPAIAIDKTGPATAQAGDKVGYVLTVTNPGDTPLTDPSVKVSDAQCNGDPVTLIGKGGDTSPTTLDPGDVWTYSCSVQTALGDTAIHNVGTVTGCDQFDKCVNADDSADTTLTQPAQLLLPERIVPGTAQLVGPTGCTGRAFSARIRGTKIATVVFFLDGKKVKTLRKPDKSGLFQLRVNPKRMKIGVHRLIANITFAPGSGTKPKTLRLSFQRCAKKLAAPRFTG